MNANSLLATHTAVFKTNTSIVNICILYSFMLKRIGKGYSTSDVSFLMGLKRNFMDEREDLKSMEFAVLDMQHFVDTLEDRGLEGIILTDLGEQAFSDYKLIRNISAELIQHDMYQIQEDKSEKLLFRLFEENPITKLTKYSTSHETATKETCALLDLLFEGMYFMSARTPLEIFIKCRALSGSKLSPGYVKDALEKMTKRKKYPKLKRVYSKHYGYTYEKSYQQLNERKNG